MDYFAYHLTHRIVDDRPVCTSTSLRRRVSRSFLERDPSFQLLVFRAIDTHLHSLVRVGHDPAGEFARRVEISIQKALDPGAPFSPVHRTPIRGQHHLVRAFDYILNQESHHGVRSDPLHEGSNLQDLLGLRVTGRHTAGAVRRFLPRVGRDHLLSFLPDCDIDADVPLFDCLAVLRDAAAAAVARPSVRGNKPEVLLARAAAVQLVDAGARSHAASALGIGVSTARRLAAIDVPDAYLEAVRGQVRLRCTARRVTRSTAGTEAPPRTPGRLASPRVRS